MDDGTCFALDEFAAGLASAGPVAVLRARARRHLAENREVLSETEYATLAGVGFVLGFGVALLATRKPLLSLFIGVAVGGGLAESVLEKERQGYEEYIRHADAADVFLPLSGITVAGGEE